MSRIDSDLPAKTSRGIVFKKSQGMYFVRSGGVEQSCAISNQMRKRLVYPIAAPTAIRPHVVAVKEIEQVDPVAIGDEVEFVAGGGGAGLIVEVLPRRNKWVRRAAGHQPLEQVIVANLDQVVAVMAAAQPPPRWELLDRYLVAAEAADLPRVLVDVSDPDVLAAWTRAMEMHATQARTRNYVELQLTRARLNGLRAGIGHAIPLFPNDALVIDSLAVLGRGARAF